MKQILLFLVVLLAFSQAMAATGDEDAVLETVQMLLDGWHRADAAAVDRALHHDFRLVTLREAYEVQIDTREHFMSTIAKLQPGAWETRLDHPQVTVSPDGIATVWSKYEFFIHGRSDHCGIEVYQLYKMASGWQIVNFADTHHARS